MQGPKGRSIFKWLAFGPALFVLTATSPATAGSAQTAALHRQVAGEEARVAKAVAARDSQALERSLAILGKLIDAALSRREGGEAVTACDMAAHSLGFVAVSVAEGLANKDQARKMLFDDARGAAVDFRKDMQACDKLADRKIGSHTSVEKALRAL